LHEGGERGILSEAEKRKEFPSSNKRKTRPWDWGKRNDLSLLEASEGGGEDQKNGEPFPRGKIDR